MTRIELHEELCDVLGSRNVYFQPPESIKMKYPCIVYNLSSGDTKYADDYVYSFTRRYNVTIIDKDPDSEIPDGMSRFKMCSFDRMFTSDNLNHFVFNLYY